MADFCELFVRSEILIWECVEAAGHSREQTFVAEPAQIDPGNLMFDKVPRTHNSLFADEAQQGLVVVFWCFEAHDAGF